MESRDINIFRLEEKIKGLEKRRTKIKESYELQTDENEKYKLKLLLAGFDKNIMKRKTRLTILKQDPLLKNGEIALINQKDTLDGMYYIYRIEDDQKVGYIVYSPEDEENIGSIGYSVKNKYRGHEYAYKSLRLLTNYLKENGVEKVTIVTTIDNIPSIKIMDKFRKDCDSKDESRESLKRYKYTLN